jgi:hypothetical protein
MRYIVLREVEFVKFQNRCIQGHNFISFYFCESLSTIRYLLAITSTSVSKTCKYRRVKYFFSIMLGYGLDSQGLRVTFLVGAGNFSLHHHVQNGSWDHPASYPMGTRDSFPGGKVVGREADHSPPSSAEVKECVELYLHSPNTPSRHGILLRRKHRGNFTFTFILPGFQLLSQNAIFLHNLLHSMTPV